MKGRHTRVADMAAAIAWLRDKPGFVHWPGGWRLAGGPVHDRVSRAEGFATDDWWNDAESPVANPPEPH